MGSTRYPGKMLEKLGSVPIIEWVLRRVKRAHMLDEVLLATTNLPRDDILVNIADQFDVNVFRGNESDVLKRFSDAAKQLNSEIVVRVCADNPFIDPFEIDRLVSFFNSNDIDYACNEQNCLNRDYSCGFGAEILRASLLEELNKRVRESRQREHVTLYLLENPNKFQLAAVPVPPELAYPELRYDVDEPEDLESLKTLCSNGITIDSDAKAIIAMTLNQ